MIEIEFFRHFAFVAFGDVAVCAVTVPILGTAP
jgi:hypothetical protein